MQAGCYTHLLDGHLHYLSYSGIVASHFIQQLGYVLGYMLGGCWGWGWNTVKVGVLVLYGMCKYRLKFATKLWFPPFLHGSWWSDVGPTRCRFLPNPKPDHCCPQIPIQC
jgi:hypothetical protein